MEMGDNIRNKQCGLWTIDYIISLDPPNSDHHSCEEFTEAEVPVFSSCACSPALGEATWHTDLQTHGFFIQTQFSKRVHHQGAGDLSDQYLSW
jgi:hypothetical protein